MDRRGQGDTAPSCAGARGRGSFYRWATFESDIAVRKKKIKETDSYESNFNVSFDSLVGSQSIYLNKIIRAKTKCYM